MFFGGISVHGLLYSRLRVSLFYDRFAYRLPERRIGASSNVDRRAAATSRREKNCLTGKIRWMELGFSQRSSAVQDFQLNPSSFRGPGVFLHTHRRRRLKKSRYSRRKSNEKQTISPVNGFLFYFFRSRLVFHIVLDNEDPQQYNRPVPVWLVRDTYAAFSSLPPVATSLVEKKKRKTEPLGVQRIYPFKHVSNAAVWHTRPVTTHTFFLAQSFLLRSRRPGIFFHPPPPSRFFGRVPLALFGVSF